MAARYLACIAAGYLLGSVNSSILVSRLLMGYDIRTKGSGNAGLTNSLRTMGLKPTLLVLAGDIAKTALACLLGGFLLGPLGKLIGGSAAIIGHMFPVYFRFRGGKGILAGGTMMAMFDWRVFCIVMAVFLLLVAVTRWVSLGSVAATCMAPFVTWYFYQDARMTALLAVMAAAVVYMHRANIVRIAHGEENRLSLRGGRK